MKKGIHPNNRLVVFKDISTGEEFLVKSTIETKGTTKYKDGNEYPLHIVEISSSSHPFFTGKQQIVDTAGKVDKFKKRYGSK